MAHPLTWALLAGVVTYLAIKLIGSADPFGNDCAGCWIKSSGGSDEEAAIVAAGATGGGKYVKNTIDKWGKGPLSYWYYMYDIASQKTPEAQQEKALEKLWSITGIEHAPEGSPGGDIKEAGERFKQISKGESGI